MSERPRRSTRQPQNPPTVTVAPPKRKTYEIDPEQQLVDLFENPKSLLTSIDISDILNTVSWEMLSSDTRSSLMKLLPQTAFYGFHESISRSPLLRADCIDCSIKAVHSPDELDLDFFKDSHLLAAAHTFQDHIHSKWMSAKHLEKVQAFQDGVRSGSLAAPWKDETWLREHAPGEAVDSPSEVACERAGGPTEVRLVTLARKGIIRVGDVIAYKRNFTSIELAVEKDVIVQSIKPSSCALTVLAELGTTKYLPAYLLARDIEEPRGLTRSMTITSPKMLETGILDIDGRVEKSDRLNGNAWKCFTLWRWRSSEYSGGEERGGRENHGTLFYLRDTFYHER